MPCLLQTHEPTAMEGAAISAKSCENLLAARCPLLARQRRDSGGHPSGSHQGCSGHTGAQPVHASSKMPYTQSTFV